jgi:hypothetical protein
MSDFLPWLGGADRQVLRQVPSARNRFVQMAGVLLTTAGLAVASMTFALHDGLKATWLWAAVLGVLWGVVILNIDRFLLLSLGTTRKIGHLALLALPRLAMAAVLSLAISTPLVLRVFSSDIKAQIYTEQLHRSAEQAAGIANSKEAVEAASLAKQIAQFQAILDGRVPVSVNNPVLVAAQRQVAGLTTQEQQDQKAANVAYEAWECELYGAGATCHSASSLRGAGPLAGAKEIEYRQAQSALAAVTTQLQAATKAEQATETSSVSEAAGTIAGAQANARASLPPLQARYAVLETGLQKVSNQGTQVNFADTGILAQLQALSTLSSHNQTLWDAHLIVMALFFIIEILPVTVKILLNLQPMTAYEIVAKADDDELMERHRSKRIEARHLEAGKSRTRLAVEDDMRQREEGLGKQANAHVAAEMTSVLDLALQDWSRNVRDRFEVSGPAPGDSEVAPTTTPGAGHANGRTFATQNGNIRSQLFDDGEI